MGGGARSVLIRVVFSEGPLQEEQVLEQKLDVTGLDRRNPGYARIRGKLKPRILAWLRKAIEFRPQDRYRNAVAMERAFNEIHAKVLRRVR